MHVNLESLMNPEIICCLEAQGFLGLILIFHSLICFNSRNFCDWNFFCQKYLLELKSVLKYSKLNPEILSSQKILKCPKARI